MAEASPRHPHQIPATESSPFSGDAPAAGVGMGIDNSPLYPVYPEQDRAIPVGGYDTSLETPVIRSPGLHSDTTLDADTGKEAVFPDYASPRKDEIVSQPVLREAKHGSGRGRRIGPIPLWVCSCLVIGLILAIGLGIGLSLGLKKKYVRFAVVGH
jgi:hypothetical protein